MGTLPVALWILGSIVFNWHTLRRIWWKAVYSNSRPLRRLHVHLVLTTSRLRARCRRIRWSVRWWLSH